MKTSVIKVATAFFSLLAVIILPGCTSDSDVNEPDIRENKPNKEFALSSEQAITANSLQDFYINFTKDMAIFVNESDDFKSKNMVVSPLSAAILLGMVANGVDDNNIVNFTDYLGTSDIQTLNSLCNTLLKELPERDNLTDLILANSAWVNMGNNLSFNKNYSSILSGTFFAETFSKNFASDNGGTIRDINRWCENNTKGGVRNYMKYLDSNAFAVLLNALHFDAPWDPRAFKYGKIKTEKRIFHGLNGDSQVEMMVSEPYLTHCRHVDNYAAYLIQMGNSGFKMYLLLPDEGLTISELTNSLIPERLYETFNWASGVIPDFDENANEDNWQEFVVKRVTLTIPKLSIQNRFDISEMLEARGLNGMTSGISATMFNEEIKNLSIKLETGASFTIAERGVKADVVTSAVMGDIFPSGIPDNPVFDRPFMFFIQEPISKAIIMSGQVTDL